MGKNNNENDNSNIPVFNGDTKRVQEMFEEVKNLDKYDSADDVEEGNIWAGLLTDKFLRKTKKAELKKKAKAVMDKYNEWFFELTDLLDEIRDETAGFKPPVTGPDGTGVATSA